MLTNNFYYNLLTGLDLVIRSSSFLSAKISPDLSATIAGRFHRTDCETQIRHNLLLAFVIRSPEAHLSFRDFYKDTETQPLLIA